ncbi:MAG: non-canonical purine NTP diphosphatase [Bacteroidota bacterium]
METSIPPTDQLIFATGNPNKVREVRELLLGIMEVKSMKEIGCHEDLPETNPTLEANAIQKAQYLVDHYQVNCFSEDTGLEVDALNGEPGVYSARYSGPERDANRNMEMVLEKLGTQSNRGAQFRTVIALLLNGTTHLFEGIVRGRIAHEKVGEKGFGYDPIFIPDGYETTFAEMDSSEKNKISHRARAIEKLIAFLKQHYQN